MSLSVRSEDLVQRIGDVGDEILGILETDRKPQMSEFLEVRRVTIRAAAATAAHMDDKGCETAEVVILRFATNLFCVSGSPSTAKAMTAP
jgi:hypothetical protein